MSIFGKIKDTATRKVFGSDGGEGDNVASAPDIATAMDKFTSQIAATDVGRTNLFLVYIEKPVDKTPPSSESKGFGLQDSLNGLTDNALVSQGISALTNNVTGLAQSALKESVGPYSTSLLLY